MGQRIDVNHLNIFYGDFLAVEDVNINIEANKVTAFIGPSGCGKSTVLRTLDRMHEIIPGAHCEGEVLLEGKNLYDKDVDPVAVRRDVGMVFQRPNPFPTMSIRENVLAGVKLNNRKISKSDADDLVEWALRGANLWNEVKDRLDNPGIGLSGGQQQRLCIARAVAVHPQVLLMDEPEGRRPAGSPRVLHRHHHDVQQPAERRSRTLRLRTFWLIDKADSPKRSANPVGWCDSASVGQLIALRCARLCNCTFWLIGSSFSPQTDVEIALGVGLLFFLWK